MFGEEKITPESKETMTSATSVPLYFAVIEGHSGTLRKPQIEAEALLILTVSA